MSKEEIKDLVVASVGFNVTNEDGSETRYEAGQPFKASELTPRQMKDVTALGILATYEKEK